MEKKFLTLSVLGRPEFDLGCIYDAKNEAVVPLTLWDQEVIKAHLAERQQNEEIYDVIVGDEQPELKNHFDLNAQLQMSFMAGLVTVKGSADLLKDRVKSSHTQRVSLLWKRTTIRRDILATCWGATAR